jgi:hypothetical protein
MISGPGNRRLGPWHSGTALVTQPRTLCGSMVVSDLSLSACLVCINKDAMMTSDHRMFRAGVKVHHASMPRFRAFCAFYPSGGWFSSNIRAPNHGK